MHVVPLDADDDDDDDEEDDDGSWIMDHGSWMVRWSRLTKRSF